MLVTEKPFRLLLQNRKHRKCFQSFALKYTGEEHKDQIKYGSIITIKEKYSKSKILNINLIKMLNIIYADLYANTEDSYKSCRVFSNKVTYSLYMNDNIGMLLQGLYSNIFDHNTENMLFNLTPYQFSLFRRYIFLEGNLEYYKNKYLIKSIIE